MTGLLLINLVLVITALEAICLMMLWLLAGRGVNPRQYFANLGSGMALMLALRSAVLQDPLSIIAGFLVLAGLLHLLQMRILFRASGAGHPVPTEMPRHVQ